MILPDLEKELAYWQGRLNLRDWKILVKYENDPRDPATGAQVYGYCRRVPDNRTAAIVVRTPTKDSDIAETYDTFVHELLHCVFATLEGPRIAEENAVWTLAPLLTELRLQSPAKAMVLCKAISRIKGFPAAVLARAGGSKMDPEKIKAIIAALREGNGDAALTLLEGLLADAAAGGPVSAAPPKEESAAPQMGMPEKPEDKPVMKTEKNDDTALKRLEAQMQEDRAAAVDGLLDTRPDLNPKQRAMLREMGLEKGVAKVREGLAELIPAPKTEPKAAPVAEVRPKLGAAEVIRGGNGGGMAKVMPSGDGKVDALFRIMPSNPENDGIEIPPDGEGVLVRASIVGAFAKIKKNAEDARETLRAKMGGTK